MTVRWETAQADGAPMRVYAGAPDSPGPHPALVVAHHAPGIDAPIQDAVHRLVRAGYAAAALPRARRARLVAGAPGVPGGTVGEGVTGEP